MQYYNDLHRQYLGGLPLQQPKKPSFSRIPIILVVLGLGGLLLYLAFARTSDTKPKNATANPDDDTSKDKPKEDTKPQEPSVESPDGGSPRRSGGTTDPNTTDDGAGSGGNTQDPDISVESPEGGSPRR